MGKCSYLENKRANENGQLYSGMEARRGLSSSGRSAEQRGQKWRGGWHVGGHSTGGKAEGGGKNRAGLL